MSELEVDGDAAGAGVDVDAPPAGALELSFAGAADVSLAEPDDDPESLLPSLPSLLEAAGLAFP